MRVRAKCWLNYNGVWHKGGDEFEIGDSEIFDGVERIEPVQEEQSVEPVESEPEFQSEIFPPEEEAPKKRGRPRKNPE